LNEAEESKPKFDRNDPDQMESLKKRDIKRYRKEMKKIKKDIRAKRGEPVIDQPKPIRTPEEITVKKQTMFDKIKSKVKQGDFNPQFSTEEKAKFLNGCLGN
jgi:mRNA-degrading endonuclease RelE of RelBE toxin-antitoxin system